RKENHLIGPLEDEFYINVLYTPPAIPTSGTFTAQYYAVSDKGVKTLPAATLTVVDILRQLDGKKTTATIPVSPYGSALKSDVLTYCNNNPDSVTLINVIAIPGPYISSFRIGGYTVNGTNRTLPITLGKDECVDVAVEFDPSSSPDPLQTQTYVFSTDGCTQSVQSIVQALVSIGSPTILGVTVPTLLSCDSKTDTVVVGNPNPGKVSMTVKSVAITGADAANFIAGAPSSNTLPGGKTVDIPVTFAPIASPGPALTNYNANVEVTLTNASGVDTVLIAPLAGSANGMNVLVNSSFVVQSGKANGQTSLPLPMNVSFTRNGLSNQVDEFGITRITLTYTYNTDLLDVRMIGKVPDVSGIIGGWSVDPASNVDNATGTLTVILNGSVPLTDAQATNGILGTLNFTPHLAKAGTKATAVLLAPPVFETAPGVIVGNCLAITQSGTQFTLIYECGDSTLAYFLANGTAPTMIKPVNPNPVSATNGGSVNFEYMTRQGGVVSIVIYDELGKEITRVINKQYHPAGAYEIRADVSKLQSGSYVYRYQVDNGRAISGRLVVTN
ncbi:MAG: hypothetical protein ABI778_03630, partial [Ignavibacteriota bacterium]